MKLAIAIIFVLAFTLPLLAEEPTHTKDTLATVKENVKAGKALIVDVREQNEWDAGHLAGAVHLPMTDLQDDAKLAELVKKLDKKKIIYTHCKAGGRALACGELLKEKGFDVRPLKAGYQTLVEGGFEKAK